MTFHTLGQKPNFNDAVLELMKTEQREHSALRRGGVPRLEDCDRTIERRQADVQRWLSQVTDEKDAHAWLMAALHCMCAATAAMRADDTSLSATPYTDCPDCREGLPWCGTCSGTRVVPV